MGNCDIMNAIDEKTPGDDVRFLIDVGDASELEKFCGMRPQFVVCESDLGLLTLQLKGGFCHKGLVVSISGEMLTEARAQQASQASETWRWKRVDDFIYWYEE